MHHVAGIEPDCAWGGDVEIRLSRAPHWGELADNVYFAQGFSGHSIAATGLARRVIAEAIQGQSERLDVFGNLRQPPLRGRHPHPKRWRRDGGAAIGNPSGQSAQDTLFATRHPRLTSSRSRVSIDATR